MTFSDFPEFPAITEQKEEAPTTFRGKDIDSKEEWWIIKVLLKLNRNFIYQYPVFGGYRRGGFIIDFFVEIPPTNLFIEFYGAYWHEGARGSDDDLRERIIENTLNIPVEGIYQSDAENEESIERAVRRLVL